MRPKKENEIVRCVQRYGRTLVAWLIASVFTAAVPAMAQTPARASAISVGIISADSPGEGKSAWEPFLAEIAKELNEPIKGVYTPTYAGVLNAAIDGRVQLARMSPRMALDAVASGKLEVFAQQLWSDGTTGYRSQLVVRLDSPLKSIADVVNAPGKYRYGHSERHSTSGYMIPEQLFAKYRIAAPLHFTRMVEGTHQSSLLDLANKEVDVAAVNSSRYKKFAEKFPDEAKRLRVIWESDPIPDVMWLIRTDLDSTTKAKLQRAILQYGKGARAKEQLIVLRKIYDLKGFAPATNGTLAPVVEWSRLSDRAIAERAGNGSELDRRKRLDEIDRAYAQMASTLGIR